MGNAPLIRKDGVHRPSKGRQIFLYIGPFPALAFL